MTDFVRIAPAPHHELAEATSVRTRDGLRLATDVYLPGGDRSPGETILIRLPYDKLGAYTYVPTIAEYLMRRGYRVVAQDVRGKFRSEGQAILFVNEVDDGYDTLQWITQQEWSNGSVAMWGDSYYGYTQWAAAASGHPALKAIAPRVTGTRLGEPVRRQEGARTSAVEMGITNLYALTHFFGADTYLWEPDWSRRDFAAQAERFMAERGRRSVSYDLWNPHAVSLRRFPGGSAFAGRSVPTLHTIGWWDNCAPLSWADVEEIASRPAWDEHHHLRIESIDHENHALLEADEDRVEERDARQIAAMLPGYLDPALEFFEIFVRGKGRAADVPRVTWNLAGTDEWRVAREWPPPEARRRRLFALADGGLGTVPDVGSATVQWTHDPFDLVPSSVDDAFSYLREHPDEAPLGARPDVVVFTGRAQADDVELAGPATATVSLWSTGPVADCFVRLLDVSPDGTALRIARGQVQLMDATRAHEVLIDLGQLGYLLRRGHRLRLHVHSSDYPEFLPQPGDGADPWIGSEAPVSTTQSIDVGGETGLVLELGVLKGELA